MEMNRMAHPGEPGRYTVFIMVGFTMNIGSVEIENERL
jgi:hypothetical protein